MITPLSPPANVALTSGVQLTSLGNENGVVANTGTTLFGAVMDNSMYDMVNVAITPGNRTTSVDVGPTTGQFAVRLFAEDFAAGPNITVTLTGGSSASEAVASQPVTYALTGAPVQDGVTQALSRLTFGPTPELYAQIRAEGFMAFVEQQLNPETIADTAFLAMDPYSLLRPTARIAGIFDGIMSHDAAYAIFSEKQLREVMGRFWANHFHAVTKDTDVRQQNMHDRAFFRANAFGKFEDLLLYSARSPLMSQFLDNDQNRRNGLNLNYAREILELHTVGVNAGYTEADVREVARVFTGWSYVQTNRGVAEDIAREFEFLFRSRAHDTGNKAISFLNMTIPGRTGEDGVKEGEELIAALADNVNTRNFVCGKIVKLLVADTPPANFISSCVSAWESSDGDTREMLRAILLDPAYITTVEYQRNKAKTPFEYAVSIARALGAVPSGDQVNNFYRDIREIFRTAGEAYLEFQVPTGLPEVAAAWMSSATMINAYNEAMDITERRHLYGIDLGADILDAGLETAEEVAAYLLTIATADRFRQEEFDAIVSVLKGPDGIFEPRITNETLPLERAMGVLMVTPSFQLQ